MYGEYEVTFGNLLFPLLLKAKSSEILTVLIKQPGFIFTQRDVLSFVKAAILTDWHAAAKTFLWSTPVHALFLSKQYEIQTGIVESLVDICQDAKSFKAVMEESLTRRPFAKHLFLVQLRRSDVPAGCKLANLCLKSLIAEDLWHLSLYSSEEIKAKKGLEEHESDVREELQKVMRRYRNEGVPD